MIENNWGQEVFTRFPELIEECDKVDNPYSLWFALTHAFIRAYEPPKNQDLIDRIFQFSVWCCSQPESSDASNDLGTIVCTYFYEEIPTCDAAILDMPKWFSHSDVLLMKPIFSYNVGEPGFTKILAAYNALPKNLRKASWRA